MPAKLKRAYRIEVQDLLDLQENIETLLNVKVELGCQFRLRGAGGTQALVATVYLVDPNTSEHERKADYKTRTLPGGDVDIVHVYYDLLWDLVQESQSRFPF